MPLTSSTDAHIQELIDNVQELLWREYYHPGCNSRKELSWAVKELWAVRMSITLDKPCQPHDRGPAGEDGGPSVTDDGVSRG